METSHWDLRILVTNRTSQCCFDLILFHFQHTHVPRKPDGDPQSQGLGESGLREDRTAVQR